LKTFVLLWTLLVLPLPGVQTGRISKKSVTNIVSGLLRQDISRVSESGTDFDIKVKPKNRCSFPFAKNTCILTRFANEINVNKGALIGPFTGHLAMNSVIGLSTRFDGAPVSRNSAMAVMVMVSPAARHVATGLVITGQDLDTPRLRAVALRCEGMYAVDMLYSGIDPALGRVWHRAVISGLEGRISTLFTTGGFAMGPVAAFSVGPGYWWQQPFDGLVHLSAWNIHDCALVQTGLDLAPGKPVKIDITHADLENITQTHVKIVIRTPFDLKAFETKKPMAILGWFVIAGRMLKTLPNAIPWLFSRAEITFVLYLATEMPADTYRAWALWKATG